MPDRVNWFSGAAVSLVCAASGAALLIPSLTTAQAAVPRKAATAPKKTRDAVAVKQKPKPLFRDFMGLNVHTVQFKTDLYAPVCRRLRDYHPLGWDIIGDDPGHLTKFPMAANGVDWGMLYGSWVKAGFDVDACVMFDQVPPGRWKEPARELKYVPMQARRGDYALFFRKAAVEITFENERYLVVPQAAILALVRE